MITNSCQTEGQVKFISYTGEYPNLCSGVLTLEIEGKTYKFGHNFHNSHINPNTGELSFSDESSDNPNFNRFWMPGGSCGFIDNYTDSYCHHAEWEIDESAIPTQFQKYISEIDKVFNKNVPFGCCGGCL